MKAEDINVSYEDAIKIAPPPVEREDYSLGGVDTQGREIRSYV